MPQLFNLGGLQVQSLNELRINKLMSEDGNATLVEYDSANTGWTSEVPGYYIASDRLSAIGSSAKQSLKIPAMKVDINGVSYKIGSEVTLNLNSATEWESNTTFQTAGNRIGTDFYVYVVPDTNTSYTAKVVLSDNSSAPYGWTANNSRKIGGFHCLCADAGTLQTTTAHPYYQYVAGDVMHTSVWDQFYHRPVANPEGMVYSDAIQAWVDIYLASGTGANIASTYGATITVSRSQVDFNDDFGLVGKRLLTHDEFSKIAYGSVEEGSYGASSPGTTGGHSSAASGYGTASTRMLSHCGVEDATGVVWVWLSDHMGSKVVAQTRPIDWSTRGSWYQVSSGAESTDPRYGLVAGGRWDSAGYAGSLSRVSNFLRSVVDASVGGRGVSGSKSGRF